MLYIVSEKDIEIVLSMKLSRSFAKALRDCATQSGNGQFASHTCCTMHRNVNIVIVTVQTAADDEHSNPIATVKPDVIMILRAGRGIVIREWIKTKFTHVQTNLGRIFAFGRYFYEVNANHSKQNLFWRNSWLEGLPYTRDVG